MKILVAHNFYKESGGEDECVAAETALLRENGHAVIEYRVHNDSIDALNPIAKASRTIWSRPAYNELRQLLRLERPQIAHFHNTFPLISPAGYYAARAENVAVVQTLHNFRLLCSNALFLRDGKVCEDCLGRLVPWPGIMHRCYRGSLTASSGVAAMLAVHRLTRTWTRAVDVYIALTEFARGKLVEGGLPGEKIAIKPNFIQGDSGPGGGRGGYGLFVGRLSAEKGIDTLTQAWRQLKRDIPLKIVGDGPLAPMVREAAAMDPRIQYMGRVPIETVYGLMGDAAVVILPSRCYETFGRVIIEAYAKGTPVIVSGLGAIAELVEDGRTGLHFTPGDAGDLARKVEEVTAEPARLWSMRQAARRQFETRFTAERNYASLMKIYDRAIAAGGNRAAVGLSSPPAVQGGSG